MQCSVCPRSHSPVPIRSFTHVSRVRYWKPQASTTSKATRRWALVVHNHKMAFSSAISATGIALIFSMSMEKIKAMPVAEIADENAILWLWTTNAHLRVAFDVVEAWGFQYRTLLTWVKDRMGTGEWLRGQTEHCLQAARGKPVFLHGQHTTVIQAIRREHSRKPEEFYSLV